MKKIVTIVVARPQFVKCAALRKVFDDGGQIDEILVHTGQHYDFSMSEVFFQELGIRAADHFLGINGKSHGAMTGEMLVEIEKILLTEKPDAVLVYGDTNSTVAGSLAAAKLHIPVFHVEAGLRSFNKKMPEEINRILTDHVSALLFCSTTESVTNLSNENITQGVHHVGDIMYDVTKSVHSMTDAAATRATYAKDDRKLAICTIHRAENTADPVRLQKVVDFVKSYSKDYAVILPLHPGAAKKIADASVDMGDLTVIDPLPYIETQALISISDLVLTDSGGMQKEAYFHGVDCVTLRDETEWVETIQNGWNVLWTNTTRAPKQPIEEYGNGDTAERIHQLIVEYFQS